MIIQIVIRYILKARTWKLTKEHIPEKSPTNAHGNLVAGSLQGRMSWHVILGSTQVQNLSNAIFAQDNSRGVIICHFIWNVTNSTMLSFIIIICNYCDILTVVCLFVLICYITMDINQTLTNKWYYCLLHSIISTSAYLI